MYNSTSGSAKLLTGECKKHTHDLIYIIYTNHLLVCSVNIITCAIAYIENNHSIESSADLPQVHAAAFHNHLDAVPCVSRSSSLSLAPKTCLVGQNCSYRREIQVGLMVELLAFIEGIRKNA